MDINEETRPVNIHKPGIQLWVNKEMGSVCFSIIEYIKKPEIRPWVKTSCSSDPQRSILISKEKVMCGVVRNLLIANIVERIRCIGNTAGKDIIWWKRWRVSVVDGLSIHDSKYSSFEILHNVSYKIIIGSDRALLFLKRLAQAHRPCNGNWSEIASCMIFSNFWVPWRSGKNTPKLIHLGNIISQWVTV